MADVSGTTYSGLVVGPVVGPSVGAAEVGHSSEVEGGGYGAHGCELEDEDSPSFSGGESELTKRGRFVGLTALPLPLPPSERRLVGRVSSEAASATALITADAMSASLSWLSSFIGSAFLRTRMSFRIRILMPWSASEQDNGVDSKISSGTKT